MIDPNLSTLRDFVQQAASVTPGICGEHAVHVARYTDRQVAQALAAADRAIAERQRYDTPAWEANERLNGVVDRQGAEIARLRTVIANAASAVDAILRGLHAGWDQALAKLRDDLRGDAS